MQKGKTARHRAQRQVEADCADCASARRCWTEPPTKKAGVSVRRHDPLEKGAMLFQQGDAFAGIYVVLSGCLCLSETSPDGSEHIVGFSLAGDIVGLESWVCGRCTYTATAAQSTTLCRLKWSNGSNASASQELLQRLLAKAASQLDRAKRSWASFPAVERVAAFVEDFTRRAGGGAHSDQSKLPITRAQIGSYLGLAEETVVRALAQLRASRISQDQRDHCTLSEGIRGSEST
jgi:CRP/FNR family transcriptional regulator